MSKPTTPPDPKKTQPPRFVSRKHITDLVMRGPKHRADEKLKKF